MDRRLARCVSAGAFQRARSLVLGLIVSVRLHPTSHAICATGRQFVDWTGTIEFAGAAPWDPHRLFDPVFDRLPQLPAGWIRPHRAPVSKRHFATLANF